MPIAFNITAIDDEYSSTLDSPSQNAMGLPVTSTSAKGDSIFIEMTDLGVRYRGKFKDSVIDGQFTQGMLSQQLVLRKGKVFSKPKPQEPKPPFPYTGREVMIPNTADNIVLAGTLTLPQGEGPFPGVVLITGSGPQNRNEELLGHKPFLVIADYLTRNGIAVLRMDDRGVGGSTGVFATATTENFVTDIEAAFRYMQTVPEVMARKVGLMGHSEGGMIAPMVAAKNPDVAFVVSLAGLGIPGDRLLLEQQQLLGKAEGMSEKDLKEIHDINEKIFAIVKSSDNPEDARKELTKKLRKELAKEPDSKNPGGKSDEEVLQALLSEVVNPWMYYFIRFDPAPYWKATKCPVLAVNGSLDLQVPPEEDLEAIEKAVKSGGNNNVTVKEYPALNHLFQHCKTGATGEYARIAETFSPEVMSDVKTWILAN